MRNFLIALLLAIVSLQATVVAVSDYGVATSHTQQLHAYGAAHLSEDVDLDVDDDKLKSSAAIEELSDYLPADLPVPRATRIAPPSRPAELALMSIYLPGSKPPPRG